MPRKSTFCDGVTRRDFLHAGTIPSGIGPAPVLRSEGQGRVEYDKDINCIRLMLVGGPSH